MAIDVRQLAYSYDGKRVIFEDVSLRIPKGQVVCLLGPNGIGKTTLLSCIMGLLTPRKGDILIDEENSRHLSPAQLAQRIGYVPQFIQPSFDYTVLEYVTTGWAPWLKVFEKPGEEHYAFSQEILKEMDIAHLQEKAYSKLSGGETQLVSIARSLVQGSSYILLDEPTAHLDFGNQVRILELVRSLSQRGKGIFMTTHHPDHVLMLDAHVGLFDRRSRFHFGPWREAISEEVLSEIYGVPVSIEKLGDQRRPVCFVESLNGGKHAHRTNS